MSSTINLEDLPQLVMGKITSLLNHKELLALEQVSRKLNCAVDAHFSTTDHLIIGSLPKLDTFHSYNQKYMTVKDKKRRDGFFKIIKRCGIRLRTIQITVTCDPAKDFSPNPCDTTWRLYFEPAFASAEWSNNCPNIENIIVSPNIDLDVINETYDVLFQKLLLYEDDVEMYANNIKLSTGKTCQLRSIQGPEGMETPENSFQRMLDLYSNIEQLSVCNPDEKFFKCLNQFMKNGLKVLEIRGISRANLRIAMEYCKIWKDLRVLSFAVAVESEDDIAALNKLQLPKITKLEIDLVNNCFGRLNENICDSVIECFVTRSTLNDYSVLKEFKNLQRFNITNSKNLRAIAQGSFPKLRRIGIMFELCWPCCDSDTETCALKFLPQIFIKCNQLTNIDIPMICHKSARAVWQTLRHCKAAKMIKIERMFVLPLTITYEDVKAICQLPNLLHFMFGICNIKEDDNTNSLHLELMERAVNELTDFQLEYKFCGDRHHNYILYRIN